MISLHCSTEFQTKILNTPPLCGGDFLLTIMKPGPGIPMLRHGLKDTAGIF
jgi:hypothetical protein